MFVTPLHNSYIHILLYYLGTNVTFFIQISKQNNDINYKFYFILLNDIKKLKNILVQYTRIIS